MRYSFIININSGRGNQKKDFLIVKEMLPEGDTIKFYETASINQMEKILAKEKELSDVLIFAGGDGTFRAALSYCYKYKIKLPIGLIPAGSGNDFVRSLNISNDLEKNMKAIIAGNTQIVYPIQLNDSVYFNVASVGLDAEIVNKQKVYKKYISGSMSYMASTIENLVTFKPHEVELYIDGEKINNKYSLIAMASGKYYGGGMNIAPNADLHSEYINVMCLKENNKLKWPYYLTKMIKGKHLKLKGVDEFNCKSLIIKSKREIKINLDGDLTMGNYIKVKKITNSKIRILTSSAAI